MLDTRSDPQPRAPDEPTPILVVDVDERRCGLLASCVLELHRMVAVHPLPGAPAGIDGVIDLHGEIVAVIELRSRLGDASRPADPLEHLVVAWSGNQKVALRVDRALDLITAPNTEVVEATTVPSRPQIQGVARLDHGLLLIHDIAAFLSETDAAVLATAIAELEAQDVEP